MKKYRVTDEHPAFKEGLLIQDSLDEPGEYHILTDEAKSYIVWEEISQKDIDSGIADGWIEEIQEPEFTRFDLINFADYYHIKVNAARLEDTPFYANDAFEKWIKNRTK